MNKLSSFRSFMFNGFLVSVSTLANLNHTKFTYYLTVHSDELKHFKNIESKKVLFKIIKEQTSQKRSK